MARLFNSKERWVLRLTSFSLCRKCGAKIDRSFHADHIKPFSKDGETSLANGQALCAECNLKKGAKENADIS